MPIDLAAADTKCAHGRERRATDAIRSDFKKQRVEPSLPARPTADSFVETP
jgi:hypothetical protein